MVLGRRSLFPMCLLLLLPTVTAAHDHRPPRTVLRHAGESVQKGQLLQYCWVTQVDDGNALSECEDRVWDFPNRDRVDPQDRLVIRIFKTTEPTSFSIEAWPERGDEITGPTGGSESLPFVLEPRVVDGEVVAWNVIFTVVETDRHYFIRAGGTWPDEQGAPESNQDAYWLFHLRT